MLYFSGTGGGGIRRFSLKPLSNESTIVAATYFSVSRIYVDDDLDGPAIYGSLLNVGAVKKWTPDFITGVQVGGDCRSCSGVFVDKEKNVYMAETLNNRVLKWSPATGTTTVIAGKINASESTDEFLKGPEDIHVSRIDGSLYVADAYHNRIQKWPQDASAGFTVAGSSLGLRGSGADSLSYPLALFVDDETDTIYVADSDNHRIQRWLVNASKGETIAGGNRTYIRPIDLESRCLCLMHFVRVG